jgi:transposase
VTTNTNDVPLAHAMLCWEPRSSQAAVVYHPDARGVSDAYTMTAGACFAKWQRFDDHTRTLNLLIEAMQAIGRDDVDARAVIHALMQVPEIRSLCADDALATFGF